MKQFILNDEPDKDNFIRLTGNDYHYLVRVRRLAAGEYFPALLPNGKETLIQIISVSNNILTGKCAGNIDSCAVSSLDNSLSSSAPQTEGLARFPQIPPIILFQALPKGDKMDLIIRQAAEGGITEIIPFISDFSAVKIFKDNKKLLRWERIIKEARQQSGSKTATFIYNPMTIEDILTHWQKIKKESENQALGILFHHPVPVNENAKGQNTNRILEQKSLHGYLNNISGIIVLAVGPEGGFSEREVSLFTENGFKLLTIGDTILRTETAALYCSAAIRILLLEKDSWELKKT